MGTTRREERYRRRGGKGEHEGRGRRGQRKSCNFCCVVVFFFGGKLLFYKQKKENSQCRLFGLHVTILSGGRLLPSSPHALIKAVQTAMIVHFLECREN